MSALLKDLLRLSLLLIKNRCRKQLLGKYLVWSTVTRRLGFRQLLAVAEARLDCQWEVFRLD